jgi:hypothetical protein
MKVWRISYDGLGYITEHPADFVDELELMNVGDDFTITCEEISQEEWDNAKDFEGF